MNTEWNSAQYLRFKNQRNQPAIDLIKRISRLCSPTAIADLGCGPGNSTGLLKEEFPQAKHLKPGGILAVQFPMNNAEPLYQIIHAVTREEKWNFNNVEVDYNGTLTPHEYFNLLSGQCSHFQMWETRYYHNLKNHEALIEWVKGTRIRPYLVHLDEVEKKAFENEILDLVKKTYPVMENGEVILHFNRFFMIGIK